MTNVIEQLSNRARQLQPSKIREIAELGMKQDGVIPLYFGEGFWPTSSDISQALVDSLQANNHKYQPNNGALNLRKQVCEYSNVTLRIRYFPTTDNGYAVRNAGTNVSSGGISVTRRSSGGYRTRLAEYRWRF